MSREITYPQYREEELPRKWAAGLRYSILDGILVTIMATFLGGIFLTGYALRILNAQPYQIGLLAALPLLISPMQLLASYLIQQIGVRKPIVIIGRLGIRTLWLLATLLPLAIFRSLGDARIWVLVAINGMVNFFGAFVQVAWLSWMSDLVPENIRGRYFGKRNAICGAVGMAVSFIGGKFIDFWKSAHGGESPYGFMILLGFGVISGLTAVGVLLKIPEPEFKRSQWNGQFLGLIKKALRDINFIKLISFGVAWAFATAIAAPFYAVFMIQNLSLSFSLIALLGILAGITSLLTLSSWGIISDRFGNKLVLLISGLMTGFLPFLWLLARPQNYAILPLIHLVGGIFGAGVTLANFNIVLKLTPEEDRPVYLALFAAPTGIAGSIATAAGGYFVRALQNSYFKFFFISFSNYHLLFMLSGFLCLISLFLLQKLREPAAVPAAQIVMFIREAKEFHPILNVGWIIDYTSLSVRRSIEILERVDQESEELAAKSELFIARMIYRGEKWLRKKIRVLPGIRKGG